MSICSSPSPISLLTVVGASSYDRNDRYRRTSIIQGYNPPAAADLSPTCELATVLHAAGAGDSNSGLVN